MNGPQNSCLPSPANYKSSSSQTLGGISFIFGFISMAAGSMYLYLDKNSSLIYTHGDWSQGIWCGIWVTTVIKLVINSYIQIHPFTMIMANENLLINIINVHIFYDFQFFLFGLFAMIAGQTKNKVMVSSILGNDINN